MKTKECAACGTKRNVEEIPDVLNDDVPICGECFRIFEKRGWNNVSVRDFPFLDPEVTQND